MKTCVKIHGKNGKSFIPTLQFEYSDIQEPVVIERDDMYVISYYRELGYDKFEIYDPWPWGVHCDIECDIRGYVSPMHICCFDENEKLRYDDFKADLPDWAKIRLMAHCHGDVYWHKIKDERPYDAILYIDPKDVKIGREWAEKAFKRALRLLNGDQLYEHVTIEIDKKTHEHDEMGMVAYLWEEECTAEGLKDIKGEVIPFDYIDIERIFTFY